jgi:hypothetical protein
VKSFNRRINDEVMFNCIAGWKLNSFKMTGGIPAENSTQKFC